MERIKKYSTGYTQINNKILMDIRLSLKAKAIYAYLFSKPNGWIFHVDVMKKEIKESYRVILLAIKELIDTGYIKRNQVNKSGCFGGIEYEFIDVYRMHENRHTVKPHAEKPSDGKCTYNNTDVSKTDLLSNTDSNDPPLISPPYGGDRIEPKKEVKKKEEVIIPFEMKEAMDLWLAYRKEIRKSYKPIGLRACIKNLQEMSGNNRVVAIAIVKQSIANGWTGLFPLKSNPQTKERKTQAEETFEHNLRYLQEIMEKENAQ